mmetsp:Transcript_50960/g.164982  ORF Transcript_50960/g.164982 Transcript_50960/m.164982 type:complete len:320 (-) Transcript_50960:1043-2002(-)
MGFLPNVMLAQGLGVVAAELAKQVARPVVGDAVEEGHAGLRPCRRIPRVPGRGAAGHAVAVAGGLRAAPEDPLGLDDDPRRAAYGLPPRLLRGVLIGDHVFAERRRAAPGLGLALFVPPVGIRLQLPRQSVSLATANVVGRCVLRDGLPVAEVAVSELAVHGPSQRRLLQMLSLRLCWLRQEGDHRRPNRLQGIRPSRADLIQKSNEDRPLADRSIQRVLVNGLDEVGHVRKALLVVFRHQQVSRSDLLLPREEDSRRVPHQPTCSIAQHPSLLRRHDDQGRDICVDTHVVAQRLQHLLVIHLQSGKRHVEIREGAVLL